MANVRTIFTLDTQRTMLVELVEENEQYIWLSATLG